MLKNRIFSEYYAVAGTRDIILTIDETILIENIVRVVNKTQNRTYYDVALWKYFISIANNVITFDAKNDMFPDIGPEDEFIIEITTGDNSKVKILQSITDVGVTNDTWIDINDERYIRRPVETVNDTKMIEQITIKDSAQVDTITLTGTEGTANITGAAGLTKLVTFAAGGTTDLTQTAVDFVASHAAAYLKYSIIVTSDEEELIFTANAKGIIFTNPVITNVAGNLDANEVATQANVVALAQVDTISLSGLIGKATIAAAGGLSKVITFSNSLTDSATDFVTDNAADYLAQDIILTSLVEDLIFTANIPGTGFTNPTITPIAGDLAGSVVNTQANITAAAQIDTITLTGTSGDAYVGATGGFSNLAVFALGGTTDLPQTAADFVATHGSEYAGIGITVTNSGDDIIFTADAPGTPFDSPVINNNTGNLAGSIANTQANAIDTAQVDTVTVTGASGQATVAAAGGLSRVVYFDTDPSTSATNFVSSFAADYLAQGIVLTSSSADLIFTANSAGTGFTNPTITNTPGSIDGSVANTQINVVAVKQVDTLTLTGTLGDTNVTLAGGLTKLAEFNTSLTQTATDFASNHAAAYLAEGIVLTSSGDDVILTADVAGTGFTNAVSDNSTFIMTGTVANTLVDTDTTDTYGITTENRPEYSYAVLAAVAKVDTITLTGASGTANITGAGGLTKLVTFAAGGTTDLPQTAADFVTSHAAAYLAEAIVVTNSEADIIFTAYQKGASFTDPAIANVSGDLAGSNVNTTPNLIASEAVIAQELVDLINADGSADGSAARSNDVVIITYTSEATAESVTSCNLDSGAGDETYISNPDKTQDLVFPIETITIPENRVPLGTVYSIKTVDRPVYTYTLTEYKTSAEIAAALAALINADGSRDADATTSNNVITLTYTNWTGTSSITSHTYDGDILCLGYTKMTLNLFLDVNLALGVQVRVLGKNNRGDVLEYVFDSNSKTLSDADQNFSFIVDITGFIAVKVQTKATTVGATKGRIAITSVLSK